MLVLLSHVVIRPLLSNCVVFIIAAISTAAQVEREGRYRIERFSLEENPSTNRLLPMRPQPTTTPPIQSLGDRICIRLPLTADQSETDAKG
jgi:hypothetical protein